MAASNPTLRHKVSSDFVVLLDLCQQRPFLPVGYAVWSSYSRDRQTLKNPGFAALELGSSPLTIPMSICDEVLSWPHYPDVSLGQECQTGSMYVPFVYKHSKAAWRRGLKILRQVVPRFHYKECCAQLAMFSMTTSSAQVWNGYIGWRGCMLAIAQLWQKQGIYCILALGSYSLWTGGFGGSLKATKLQMASLGPGWNSIFPKLEGVWKGSPCRSAHCTSFCSKVNFIQR